MKKAISDYNKVFFNSVGHLDKYCYSQDFIHRTTEHTWTLVDPQEALEPVSGESEQDKVLSRH